MENFKTKGAMAPLGTPQLCLYMIPTNISNSRREMELITRKMAFKIAAQLSSSMDCSTTNSTSPVEIATKKSLTNF